MTSKFLLGIRCCFANNINRSLIRGNSLLQKVPLSNLNRIKPHFQIKISQQEEKVFDFLLGVVHHFKLNLNLRVAGGWVRDKLLNKDGGDIDITIDNLTGVEFASYVDKYAHHLNIPSIHLGIIKSNPEQSKHLETVCLTLFGIEIDINNLRIETYQPYSRIPLTRPATPSEDAHRRDFTINSLFYNLHTQDVEDYCQGVEDIKNKQLKTPKDCLQTFLDDPLRVLRAVRFACQLDFQIHPSIIQTASQPLVKQALTQKISRERIGKELSKLFITERVPLGFEHFEQMKIVDTIFIGPDIEWTQTKIKRAKDNLTFSSQLQKHSKLELSAVQKEILCQSLILSPFLENKSTSDGFPFRRGNLTLLKTKLGRFVSNTLRCSLKSPNRNAEDVARIFFGGLRMKEFLNKNPLPRIEDESTLLFVGRWLQSVHHDKWVLSAILSILLLSQENQQGFNVIQEFEHLKRLLERITSITCPFSQTELINGHDIQTTLEIPGGPMIGHLQEQLNDYLLLHPKSTKDEAICVLRQFADRSDN